MDRVRREVQRLGDLAVGRAARHQVKDLLLARRERRRGVVRLRLESETDTDVALSLSVEDTGMGIAPETLDRIFEHFSQADGSTTRQYGGTGLGLAISRRLLTLMGGTIRVESKVRKGTTFEVELPFNVPAAQPVSLPVRLAKLKGLRVLIIDDNLTNRTILQRLCQQWDFVAAGAAGSAAGAAAATGAQA